MDFKNLRAPQYIDFKTYNENDQDIDCFFDNISSECSSMPDILPLNFELLDVEQKGKEEINSPKDANVEQMLCQALDNLEMVVKNRVSSVKKRKSVIPVSTLSSHKKNTTNFGIENMNCSSARRRSKSLTNKTSASPRKEHCRRSSYKDVVSVIKEKNGRRTMIEKELLHPGLLGICLLKGKTPSPSGKRKENQPTTKEKLNDKSEKENINQNKNIERELKLKHSDVPGIRCNVDRPALKPSNLQKRFESLKNSKCFLKSEKVANIKPEEPKDVEVIEIKKVTSSNQSGVIPCRTVRNHITTVQAFSFEKRDKELQLKKEKKIQEIIKKEKLLHEFQANPVPKFIRKPATPTVVKTKLISTSKVVEERNPKTERRNLPNSSK